MRCGPRPILRARSRASRFARGSPRDLAAVRDGARRRRACAELLAGEGDGHGPARGARPHRRRARAPSAAISAPRSPPRSSTTRRTCSRDGGFVREGYSAELDEARRLKEDSRGVMAGLEAKYVERTGVKSLKVRHNNILGFYIEVTQGNAKPLLEGQLVGRVPPPADDGERGALLDAGADRDRGPHRVGDRARAEPRAGDLRRAGGGDRARARGLGAHRRRAGRARRHRRVSPSWRATRATRARVVDDSQAFEIRGGRHPVVEQALKAAKAGAFIENDCVLGARATIRRPEETADGRIWLVTGPNMAGKSTFLRQNALIAVLAQMGSYVPARSATIGALDRLFSRVGASDDLARGRSTFMVEMVETAAILNQASERSLVILDEIGRGTATFDGLSIAWATVEFLHDVLGARALFATHYHELTALARRLAGVANVTIDVREWHDEIVFLHKVKPGAADRSVRHPGRQARRAARSGRRPRARGAGAARKDGKPQERAQRRPRRAASVCGKPHASAFRAGGSVAGREGRRRIEARRLEPARRARCRLPAQGAAPRAGRSRNA